MTLRDSQDAKISKVELQKRTGKKWSADSEVRRAEDMRDIAGKHLEDRALKPTYLSVGTQHLKESDEKWH